MKSQARRFTGATIKPDFLVVSDLFCINNLLSQDQIKTKVEIKHLLAFD